MKKPLAREKSSRTKCIPFCPRVEKNRRFVLKVFKGKGIKKLNIAFAPLEKL